MTLPHPRRAECRRHQAVHRSRAQAAFGLVGTAVTDGYICAVTYLAPGQSTPVVKKATHAIHTTIGNATAPAGAGPKVDVATAVSTMPRAIVSNALRDLAIDPSFN